MKKDIGKRSYTEMYLIPKEDKNILDKCVTHPKRKPHHVAPTNQSKPKEQDTQTTGMEYSADSINHLHSSPSEELLIVYCLEWLFIICLQR